MDLSKTQRLILKALEGTAADENVLFEHLRPRLVMWAAGRLSPALRAKLEPEDVAQETLIAVHKAMPTFDGTDHRAFLAWLFRIAENRIRDMADYFGAKKRQVAPPPLTFTQTSPSTAAARSEGVDVIAKALPDLSDDYRQVFILKRLEERSVKEIAEIMGRSENAVRILYCRALKVVRDRLKEADEKGPKKGDLE